MTTMKITAIANWFGSNRSLAELPGRILSGCDWIFVPFGGGMSELPYLRAGTILVCDLHRHVINLAQVVLDPVLRAQLKARCDTLLFHEDVIAEAQAMCMDIDASFGSAGLFGEPKPINIDRVEWAAAYFASSWMGHGGRSGTDGEFDGGLSVRYTVSGGDSVKRFRSAVASLDAWGEAIRRCTFKRADCFDEFPLVKDETFVGIYSDSPFPGPGAAYAYGFSEAKFRKLAKELSRPQQAKVCVRYYDHPLIRELYPEGQWTWLRPDGGKTQANEAAPEVLILNAAAASGTEAQS